MAGGILVQVTINARDEGAAEQLLKLKQLASQLGIEFNATTKVVGATGKAVEGAGKRAGELGRALSGGFAGAIEGATGLRTVLAQVAAGYEAVHAARAFLEEGFTATSTIEQAGLGIGSEVAGNATLAGPGGEAIDGAEKLALATAEGRRQMELLGEASHAVGIEATSLAEIFTKSVGPALRGGGNLANLRQETVQLALLAQQLGIPYEKVSETLLQILNGHAQQRNQLVAILGIGREEMAVAAQRGQIQDLLNAKLAKLGDLAAQGENSLRRIGEGLKTSLEEASVKAVEPIVTEIEQKIGPALSHIDLSGLTSALRGVATEIGTALGSTFDKAVGGAKELQTWLSQHRQTVRETLANLGQVASAVGGIVASAAQMVGEFVSVGVNAGIIAGAARTLAAMVPVLAAVWAVSKVVAFASAINGVGVALVSAGTKVASFAGFLNTVRTAGLAAGLGLTATGVAAEGAIAPVTALGVATSLAAPILTVLALAVTVGAIAWNAHKANLEAAARAQREENEALGQSISLAPALIAQLHEQEQAYRRSASGSAEQHEAERQLAETKQQLLTLSPSFKGALENETLSIDGQTEALKRNVAALEQQAAAKERQAEQRAVEAERALAEAQAAHPAGQGATAGNFLTGGPQGAGIAADADDQEIKDLTKKRDAALADLKATRQAVRPAVPPATAEDSALAAVKQREDAKRAVVDEQYARGEIDAQAHQQRLNDIEFQGARDQIKIHEDALKNETDPGRRKQEVDAINALRGRQLDLVRERGVTELPAGKDHSAQDATSDVELIRKQAEDRTKVLEEHYRTEQADATRSYDQQVTDVRDYYTQRATIEYDALGREVAIKESLLSKTTETSERHRLLNEITGLEADQQNVVAISTQKQIQDLDKLEKKREEVEKHSTAARLTTITESVDQGKSAVGARAEDVQAQIATGDITKAQGAEQLLAGYREYQTVLRQAYADAVALDNEQADPKVELEIQRIRTAYNETRLEIAKASDASHELAKSLGDEAGKIVGNQLADGIDEILLARGARARMELYRQAALSIVKDLQHAFTAPLGKAVQQKVTRVFAGPKADTGAPLEKAGPELRSASDAWAIVGVQWRQIAAALGLAAGALGGASVPATASQTASGAAANTASSVPAILQGAHPVAAAVSPSAAQVTQVAAAAAGLPAILQGQQQQGGGSAAAAENALPPTPGAPPQYVGGTPGPSGALKSFTGVTGIASQIGGLIPGGGGLSQVLGAASKLGGVAQQAAAGPAGAGGLAGAGGAGGNAGAQALSAAASAVQSAAGQLSSAARAVTSAAQALSAAASAGSSGAIPGASAGGAGGLMSMLGPAAGLMMATGGYVRGPGTSTSDSVPAMLSAGEFVHSAAAVQHHGAAAMHAVNERRAMIVPAMHFRDGGFVSTSPPSVAPLRFAAGGLVSPGANAGRGGEFTSHVNLHVSTDPGVTVEHLKSPEAERVVVRHVQKNPHAIKAGLGIG